MKLLGVGGTPGKRHETCIFWKITLEHLTCFRIFHLSQKAVEGNSCAKIIVPNLCFLCFEGENFVFLTLPARSWQIISCVCGRGEAVKCLPSNWFIRNDCAQFVLSVPHSSRTSALFPPPLHKKQVWGNWCDYCPSPKWSHGFEIGVKWLGSICTNCAIWQPYRE